MTPTPHLEEPVGSTSGTGRSDLARRVIQRRQELGVSAEELAQRVGMDPNYLDYFESNASARLSSGTLNLIALALDTSPIALEGGDLDRPPGRGEGGVTPPLKI